MLRARSSPLRSTTLRAPGDLAAMTRPYVASRRKQKQLVTIWVMIVKKAPTRILQNRAKLWMLRTRRPSLSNRTASVSSARCTRQRAAQLGACVGRNSRRPCWTLALVPLMTVVPLLILLAKPAVSSFIGHSQRQPMTQSSFKVLGDDCADTSIGAVSVSKFARRSPGSRTGQSH